MTWLWISAIVVLLGAELDAEMEHQTAHDTTAGAPKPLGARGAKMADTALRETDLEFDRGPGDPRKGTVPKFRCGVSAVVKVGGRVLAGDAALAIVPHAPWRLLPAL